MLSIDGAGNQGVTIGCSGTHSRDSGELYGDWKDVAKGRFATDEGEDEDSSFEKVEGGLQGVIDVLNSGQSGSDRQLQAGWYTIMPEINSRTCRKNGNREYKWV